MSPQVAFGLGIIIGALAFLVLVLALAYRDGHPFGDTPREEQ